MEHCWEASHNAAAAHSSAAALAQQPAIPESQMSRPWLEEHYAVAVQRQQERQPAMILTMMARRTCPQPPALWRAEPSRVRLRAVDYQGVTGEVPAGVPGCAAGFPDTGVASTGVAPVPSSAGGGKAFPLPDSISSPSDPPPALRESATDRWSRRGCFRSWAICIRRRRGQNSRA